MAFVVVADDSKIICDLLGSVLTAAGHRILTVNDGATAQQAIERERPDLLLIDLVMPGQDGLQTIRNLRAGKTAIRIIAMSAGGELGVPAKEAGADAVLLKPVDFTQLVTTIDQLLNLSNS